MIAHRAKKRASVKRSRSFSSAIALVRSESPLIAGLVTTAILYTAAQHWMDELSQPAKFVSLFVWVFCVMLWCAFAAVRHADSLAELLGEPYGTLILTLSVISIEVSAIAAVMLHGSNNPTLARDTMLAVLMIVLNLMVGLCLLIGGLRHREQEFNLQGAKAFLAVLLSLSTISLILPKFTLSTKDPSLTPLQAVLFSAITIALYGTFLAIQTKRHRSFFLEPGSTSGEAEHQDDGPHHRGNARSVPYHAVLLLLTLVPIVLMSKKLAVLVDHGIETLRAPEALGGVLVAILVLSPEGLAAYHAAVSNRLQRSINICLGSALATIGLTVPAVLTIGIVTHSHVVLGLEGTEMVVLALTLILSTLTFSSPRTNVLQGAVHLVVFVVYFILIFDR
jgi:Ca2+:H+ antiporter